MIRSIPIQFITSMRCSGVSVSSIGWVVTQKCFLMYSDGAILRCGTSSFIRFQCLSSRQPSAGSQPKPDSISTTFNSGRRSKMPSMIMLVTIDCAEVACSVISSM